MSTLPAITVWQPWCSLIAIGAKPYEFRGWQPPLRLRGRRIAIHAGARPARRIEIADLIARLSSGDAWSTCLEPATALPLLDRALKDPSILPLSVVLCTAILGDPRSGHDVAAEFGGPVNDSDRDEHANWGWPLTEIVALEPPAPASGAQGFWNWNDGRAA